MNENVKSNPQSQIVDHAGHLTVPASLLTAIEAATVLQMDPRTLVRWARGGYVPAHPLGEGRRRMWRFFEQELIAWVESHSNNKLISQGRAA